MLELKIPNSITQAIRLPEERLSRELMKTLAIALYVEGLLSFGKARELAGLGVHEFSHLLGERRIPRHYGREEFSDDLAYADRW